MSITIAGNDSQYYNHDIAV